MKYCLYCGAPLIFTRNDTYEMKIRTGLERGRRGLPQMLAKTHQKKTLTGGKWLMKNLRHIDLIKEGRDYRQYRAARFFSNRI